MKEQKETATWQEAARAILKLLAERDLPLQRRGLNVQGQITVRLRPHPVCGAPVFELLSPDVRAGFALGWKDFKTVAKSARGVVRTYEVTVNCPALRKRKAYRIPSSSNANAVNIGFRRFFKQFPTVLERGLEIGGGARVLN